MIYTSLGNTEVQISRICLGTMTYGEQNTEAESHQQLDYAIECGINFIDTAEMYPVPPVAETQGRTEEYIGSWLNKRNDRDKLVIASKVSGPGDLSGYLRGGPQLNLANLEQAVNDSLKRLQTDYIDLYQIHWPARRTNFFGKLGYVHQPEADSTPIEETLEALGILIERGKIRHAGISNETAWGAMHYISLAERKDLPGIVSIQNPYNLLNRSYEVGLAEVSCREQVGLLAYSPLAFGALTGKYLHGQQPAGARLTRWERFSRYSNTEGIKATERYAELASNAGLTPAQMALAYVNTRSFVSSTIIGATDMTQLKKNIDSIDVKLTDDVLQGIEAIHTQQPYPCP